MKKVNPLKLNLHISCLDLSIQLNDSSTLFSDVVLFAGSFFINVKDWQGAWYAGVGRIETDMKFLQPSNDSSAMIWTWVKNFHFINPFQRAKIDSPPWIGFKTGETETATGPT